ncbi:MAG: MarR family transcriptional regulator [Actinobacteria bacterium]|nr:MAG: MarR family transcriptional regulator [Actinomycetota bacterium]
MSTQLLAREGAEIEAFTALLRAHAATTREFNADLVADHGLTINDYEVMLRLAHAPDRRLRRVDLAEEVFLTPSGITRLLAGLEHSGWVERVSCASDARVTYAQLTEEGLEKLRAAAKSHVASIRILFSERFSPSELEALRDLLQRLPLAEGASCEP